MDEQPTMEDWDTLRGLLQELRTLEQECGLDRPPPPPGLRARDRHERYEAYCEFAIERAQRGKADQVAKLDKRTA